MARQSVTLFIYTAYNSAQSGLWRFRVKSISDWKNIYFDDCVNCVKLNECGGMFKSSSKKSSKFIKAFD